MIARPCRCGSMKRHYALPNPAIATTGVCPDHKLTQISDRQGLGCLCGGTSEPLIYAYALIRTERPGTYHQSSCQILLTSFPFAENSMRRRRSDHAHVQARLASRGAAKKQHGPFMIPADERSESVEMLENHSFSSGQQEACAGNASCQKEQSPRPFFLERIRLAKAKLNGLHYNELAPRKLFVVAFGLGMAATL